MISDSQPEINEAESNRTCWCHTSQPLVGPQVAETTSCSCGLICPLETAAHFRDLHFKNNST